MFRIIAFRSIKKHIHCKIKLFSTVKPAEAAPSEISFVGTQTSLSQKWISFWKTLLTDYKDVIVDTGKYMKERPLKTSLWLSAFCGALACSARNPDEDNFRAHVINKSNELIFISKSIRNRNSVQHLRTIEDYYNCSQIRRISFGLFSIILRDFKTTTSGCYKDNCSFTQPTYFDLIKNHIVDVGFWKKWWILEKMMVDLDVNEEEWR